MTFELYNFEDGKPTRVNTDDGFVKCSRAFDEETDGWMLEQLDPRDFPLIMAGRQMENMVYEINRLRRENFELRKSEQRWLS